MSGKFRRQYLRAVSRTADASFVVTRPLVTSRSGSTCWSVSCSNYGQSTFWCDESHA